MIQNIYKPLTLLLLLFAVACKETPQAQTTGKPLTVKNEIRHAKGLEIYRYTDFTVIKVTNPWPQSQESFTYVLQKNDAPIPDSLKQYTTLKVPLKTVVVTSTTHIPSLEMLEVENTLVGFPGLNYISSAKTRKMIDEGKVRSVGENESLNTEIMIELSPDAVVGFSISNDNKALKSLKESGMTVLYNGDWTEESPLGKAEWIKFFGALYGLEDKAETIFSEIEKNYLNAKKLADNAQNKPTVLSGALYQGVWYMPQGDSWAALFLKDAHADYLWADTEGTGSLSLSFETVFDKAENADVWIGPSEFTSLRQMAESNPHYSRFKAFQNKHVYSFSSKKGATGGIIFYELAPNRPDLVLKDMIKILHPELLPQHRLQFFEKLQ